MEAVTKTSVVENVQKSPSGMRVVWNEFKKDKLAMFSVVLLALILIGVYGVSLILSQEEIVKIDFFSIYAPPSSYHWLGTDYGGRDIFGQLIIGTRNSFTIGLCVTVITAAIGLVMGLLAGYFGGWVDNIVMRAIDFILTLPTFMLIIVFVTIVPNYSIYDFILIMSAFYWVGKARLIRSRVLSERELDYIAASRTLGSSHFKIIVTQLLPNVISLILVNFTLSLAGNIGLETGFTFLGFGLPESTPSLGTLVSYATNPEVLQDRWWVWVPASAMILILMLSINFIGQALKRAADPRQRRA